MIGSCDCCDRKNVPLSRGFVTGIETYACFICQGDTDPDPYGELEAPAPIPQPYDSALWTGRTPRPHIYRFLIEMRLAPVGGA